MSFLDRVGTIILSLLNHISFSQLDSPQSWPAGHASQWALGEEAGTAEQFTTCCVVRPPEFATNFNLITCATLDKWFHLVWFHLLRERIIQIWANPPVLWLSLQTMGWKNNILYFVVTVTISYFTGPIACFFLPKPQSSSFSAFCRLSLQTQGW